jgi:hypothetical protein
MKNSSYINNTKISSEKEEEEEDECWIPLSSAPQDVATDGTNASSVALVRTTSAKNDTSSKNTSSHHLQLSQRRLETRTHIKRNLVNHPIDLFWKRYIVNLAKEFLQLEVSKRLGLLLVISGLFLKVFLITTWYFWYPKLAITSAIFMGSIIYLDPLDLKIHLSPESFTNILERFDAMQLRRLSFILLLFPTALEMRTLSFLTQVHAEASVGLWTIYNAMLGILILTTMLYQHKIQRLPPRDCTYQGLVTLYGSALLLAILKTDVWRLPILAAPFLTATGTLLLTYRDDDMEWISRLLRHALRLTLRDVLSSVSQKVSTDELLQLTILRWIADYWASASSSQTADDSSSASTSGHPHIPSPTQNPPRSSSPPSTNASTTSITTLATLPRCHQKTKFPRHEVQWDDLMPMLSVALDHMTGEVQQLQSNHDGNPQPTTTQLNTAVQQPTDNDAMQNLKFMLMSLNVDDRAKPAVLAYRRGVEKFPPTKQSAAMMSIIRRCPAVLTLLWHFVFGSNSLFSSIMLLFPFVVLEYCRIKNWIDSCGSMALPQHQKASQERFLAKFSRILEDTDTMMILLSGDTFSFVRPPTLLLVWQNIVSSISALEFGLTAARCAQTTTVAVGFAGNMMSLLNLGFEVSNHGLLHGLAVMAKEIITMHMNDHLTMDQRKRKTKYTSAAIEAVQNAHFFAKNVRTLAEEEELDPILRPIVSALCALSGYGWLWGNEEKATSNDDRTTDRNPQDETNSIDDLKKDAWKDFGRNPAETRTSPRTIDSNLADAMKHGGKVSAPKTVPKFSKPVGGNGGVEELGIVMEMVAQAFEQGLIEEVRLFGFVSGSVHHSTFLHLFTSSKIKAEKDDFCSKLSSLSDQELYDASVTTGMKRTLQIILQEGESFVIRCEEKKVPGAEEIAIADIGEERHHITKSKQNKNTGDTGERNAGNAHAKAVDSIAAKAVEKIDGKAEGTSKSSNTVKTQEDTRSESASSLRQKDEEESGEGDGAWLHFGMATLGVIVGGVLLSSQGRGNTSDKSQNHEQSEGRNNSMVKIVEVSEDDDDHDWVAISNTPE